MTVLTVECCLLQTVNWSITFVLTLVQSRTHVDTVQNVLHGITNWRYICWSHTMKALGSHVTFVRRNSATVVTLRYTYVDMKVWSRMFVVNVQNVSVQCMNWKVIGWYTWITNSFVVVHVVNYSNVKNLSSHTSRDVVIKRDSAGIGLINVCHRFIACIDIIQSVAEFRNCLWWTKTTFFSYGNMVISKTAADTAFQFWPCLKLCDNHDLQLRP